MKANKRLATLAALALVVACNPDRAPLGPAAPSFEAVGASSAPLVLHVVAPQSTDPAIDRFLDNHYVWLDTTARTNHKLMLFMPGTGFTPAVYQLVQQEAARVGYHVIGLMYPNLPGLAKVCPNDPDPAACYENSRLERSEEHTSELQSLAYLVCRLLLEKKKNRKRYAAHSLY